LAAVVAGSVVAIAGCAPGETEALPGPVGPDTDEVEDWAPDDDGEEVGASAQALAEATVKILEPADGTEIGRGSALSVRAHVTIAEAKAKVVAELTDPLSKVRTYGMKPETQGGAVFAVTRVIPKKAVLGAHALRVVVKVGKSVLVASAPRTLTVVEAEAPDACDGEWPAAWASLEMQAIGWLNGHRATGVFCAAGTMPPAKPVTQNAQLFTMARCHSKAMGTENFFSHKGLAQRSKIYDGVFWGENIAAGFSSPQQAVAGLLGASALHCSNMMTGIVKYVGVGYAYVPGSEWGHYWTFEFGF
jgi:uncharacterized protein YkwD